MNLKWINTRGLNNIAYIRQIVQINLNDNFRLKDSFRLKDNFRLKNNFRLKTLVTLFLAAHSGFAMAANSSQLVLSLSFFAAILSFGISLAIALTAKNKASHAFIAIVNLPNIVLWTKQLFVLITSLQEQQKIFQSDFWVPVGYLSVVVLGIVIPNIIVSKRLSGLTD